MRQSEPKGKRPTARRIVVPAPQARQKRTRAILLKLTPEEHALLSRVAKGRGEPVATATRVLALAAAQSTLGAG